MMSPPPNLVLIARKLPRLEICIPTQVHHMMEDSKKGCFGWTGENCMLVKNKVRMLTWKAALNDLHGKQEGLL